MDIEHHLIMDSEGAKPIISRAVAHGDRVYILFGRGPTSEEGGTREALDSVIRSIKWTRQ